MGLFEFQASLTYIVESQDSQDCLKKYYLWVGSARNNVNYELVNSVTHTEPSGRYHGTVKDFLGTQ